MSNQQAIASLRTLCHNCELFLKCVHEKPECFQAIELAISALQAQEIKQEVKESGCTYKPNCPNDHGYHECDYDRGILPEDDSDELDEVMQHWIKQADEQEKVAEMYPEYADECKKISNDFRQLASLLRELKRLRTEVYFLKAERENTPVDLLGDVPCKTCRWKAETTEKCEECIDGITNNYEVQIECEDCVSRKAAIDALMEIMDRPNHAEFLYTDEICKTLNELPSAQPERKKGKWTKDCACEICGFKPWYERDIHTLSFCPNCGADLRGD